MNSEKLTTDWKLKLHYGKIKTPYQHYTVIGEGVADAPIEEFSCPAGKAFMALKTWASSPDESADMLQTICRYVGFNVTGPVYIYTTEPTQPPEDKPSGYDLKFTPFS